MENKNLKQFINKRNIFILSIICIVIIFIIVAFIIFKNLNSTTNQFRKNLDNYNINELIEIYRTTSSYDEKKQLENIFEEKINSILNQFALNIISSEEAYDTIKKYENLSYFKNKIENAVIRLGELKASKEWFAKGQASEKNGNLLEAIENYLNVIELDINNYKYAQIYINNNKNTLKDNTLLVIDSLIESKDYITANKKLEILQKIFNNDSIINEKIKLIKDEAKKQEIEQYKNNQEVIVLSAKKHKEWYSDTISGVQVIVKNTTLKVVKSFVVSILAYDSSGYPLKIDYRNYEKIFSYDGANIQPNGEYGKDNYCDIYYEKDKISSALACVKNVEYYDGTIWENPYYEYWIEQYKEKPIN